MILTMTTFLSSSSVSTWCDCASGAGGYWGQATGVCERYKLNHSRWGCGGKGTPQHPALPPSFNPSGRATKLCPRCQHTKRVHQLSPSPSSQSGSGLRDMYPAHGLFGLRGHLGQSLVLQIRAPISEGCIFNMVSFNTKNKVMFICLILHSEYRSWFSTE